MVPMQRKWPLLAAGLVLVSALAGGSAWWYRAREAKRVEEAAKAAKNPKRVANLVQGELLGRLKAKGLELEQSPISMAGVAA